MILGKFIIKAIIPLLIISIMIYGIMKKVKVYECFVEGAKEGLIVCYRIFPYLLAMIFAVSVFRESKAIDYFINMVSPAAKLIGLPPELVPLVLIKPLSGSGAIGIFTETLQTYGPDSNIGRIASVIMGSTETIFYTLTVYFGAVGIKKIRHTLWAAIMTDLVAIIMAILTVKTMF